MYDDYLEYRENLHALKGSAIELGANRLEGVCIEGESLKPYDMGSEKIDSMCQQIEAVFNKTVTALTSAVTVEHEVLPGKSTRLFRILCQRKNTRSIRSQIECSIKPAFKEDGQLR